MIWLCIFATSRAESAAVVKHVWNINEKNNKNEQHEPATGMNKEVEKYEIFLFWSLRCIADECYAEQIEGSTIDDSVFRMKLSKGGFFRIFKYLLFSTLLHLPSLRFHCVEGCWYWPQYCCDFCEQSWVQSQNPRNENFLHASWTINKKNKKKEKKGWKTINELTQDELKLISLHHEITSTDALDSTENEW